MSSIEKNTITAIERSFLSGFGTETDIRDYGGELVISHDIADVSSLLFGSLVNSYLEFGDNLPLALNIKSDGLQALLRQFLEHYGIKNYFVFDMSVPDMIGYCRAGLNFATRESEYETHPVLYQDAAYVWMDMFISDWIEESHIERHLSCGKKICIVSPDLHGRPPKGFWERIALFACTRGEDVMLCTDYPEEARMLFYAKD